MRVQLLTIPLLGNNLGQVVHTCLCYQAVQFGTSRGTAMSCGWEGNRRSGVALAMHHRLEWFIHLRDEQPNMGDGGGGHWLDRVKWRPAGWSVCLPLLTFPCTMKSRSSLLAPAHLGGPGERAVKWLCVCVFIIKKSSFGSSGGTKANQKMNLLVQAKEQNSGATK